MANDFGNGFEDLDFEHVDTEGNDSLEIPLVTRLGLGGSIPIGQYLLQVKKCQTNHGKQKCSVLDEKYLVAPLQASDSIALCGGANSKCVFVSSTTSDGNLGGLDGADGTCQSLAGAAGLHGTFKAWLSDLNAGGSVAERFNHSNVPYRLVDGTEIAADWDDLIRLPSSGGAHLNDFTQTEAGAAVTGSFWSGTLWNGTALDSYTLTDGHNCAGWTTTTPYGGDTFYNTGGYGAQGRYTYASPDSTFRQWSFYNVQDCANNLHLLCFEQ